RFRIAAATRLVWRHDGWNRTQRRRRTRSTRVEPERLRTNADVAQIEPRPVARIAPTAPIALIATGRRRHRRLRVRRLDLRGRVDAGACDDPRANDVRLQRDARR